MSFLPARYRQSAEAARVELASGGSMASALAEAPDGAEVRIGIRPENYRLSPDGPLVLTVEVVEPTGPETHVIGNIAGEEVRAVFRDRIMPAPGEILRLSALPEHIHLFDAASGRRLGT